MSFNGYPETFERLDLNLGPDVIGLRFKDDESLDLETVIHIMANWYGQPRVMNAFCPACLVPEGGWRTKMFKPKFKDAWIEVSKPINIELVKAGAGQ